MITKVMDVRRRRLTDPFARSSLMTPWLGNLVELIRFDRPPSSSDDQGLHAESHRCSSGQQLR
jgi:hypothetical protein